MLSIEELEGRGFDLHEYHVAYRYHMDKPHLHNGLVGWILLHPMKWMTADELAIPGEIERMESLTTPGTPPV